MLLNVQEIMCIPDGNQSERRRVAANALSDSAGDIEVYRGQCFYHCHDLETVICYAPLENTNKGLFEECKGLKTVIFVKRGWRDGQLPV